MKRIFLITLLANPFLIKAMDESSYVVPESIAIHKSEVLSLCTATYSMLQKFRTKHEKRTEELVSVVDQMRALELAKPPVTEKEIGFFIYEKKPQEFKSIFSNTCEYYFAAVFFARLHQYHKNIISKQHVSPNVQQISNYFKKLHIERIVTKNSERNIIIPQETIDEIIIPTPGSVDVEQFEVFMNDIESILKDTRTDIESTINLIYHNELKGKANKELSGSRLS